MKNGLLEMGRRAHLDTGDGSRPAVQTVDGAGPRLCGRLFFHDVYDCNGGLPEYRSNHVIQKRPFHEMSI